MHIHWHPGHMTKAYRMMQENLKLVDGMVYVLDARCPISCINPKITALAQGKKIIYVLNKRDLIESADAKRYLAFFSKNYGYTVCVNATNSADKNALTACINRALGEKSSHLSSRGIARNMRLMVAGVPNTGKSMLINMLSGQKRAATGNKAGVTRGKQWINAGSFDLMDTPGTTPPAFENQTFAKRLAYVGSINDDILDFPSLALALIEDLQALKPSLVLQKYDVVGQSALQIMENICIKRNYYLKAQEFDYERCAQVIIDDFRRTKIAKIALDELENE